MKAPNSVGAKYPHLPGFNKPMKTGKTAVAQTRSATRNNARTSYRCALLTIAATLTPMRTNRLSHLMISGEDEILSKSELRREVIPF